MANFHRLFNSPRPHMNFPSSQLLLTRQIHHPVLSTLRNPCATRSLDLSCLSPFQELTRSLPWNRPPPHQLRLHPSPHLCSTISRGCSKTVSFLGNLGMTDLHSSRRTVPLVRFNTPSLTTSRCRWAVLSRTLIRCTPWEAAETTFSPRRKGSHIRTTKTSWSGLSLSLIEGKKKSISLFLFFLILYILPLDYLGFVPR